MDTYKAPTTHISCLEEFSRKRQADERGVCLHVSSVVPGYINFKKHMPREPRLQQSCWRMHGDGVVCKDELTMCCLVLSWVQQLT
ncbi:hypothetical protein HF325_003503 [Metschnikowia pulcherrima]|uniref:Uncharacterized protein n=1 Tax=Metschnikowia pulcherrima TaxID=27326 RepID=A0A8H7GSK5_9ASCO|nr:hypothetical protein HF325_003503 [Metschnikowia pulcherrima]